MIFLQLNGEGAAILALIFVLFEPDEFEGGLAMAGTEPVHDHLIVKLLEIGKIRVDRDEQYTTYDDESGLYLPTTRIHVRDDRTQVIWPAILHTPEDPGYPRLRIILGGRRGKQIWLLAHRISWVAEHGATAYELDHRDRNRRNFNLWNLVPSDRFIQMANRGISKADSAYLEALREEFEMRTGHSPSPRPSRTGSALDQQEGEPF